jgi:hypothetical protein
MGFLMQFAQNIVVTYSIITFSNLQFFSFLRKSVASPRLLCSVHTHPPGGRIFRVRAIWKQRHLTENFNVECGNHNSMPLPGVPRYGLLNY